MESEQKTNITKAAFLVDARNPAAFRGLDRLLFKPSLTTCKKKNVIPGTRLFSSIARFLPCLTIFRIVQKSDF